MTPFFTCQNGKEFILKRSKEKLRVDVREDEEVGRYNLSGKFQELVKYVLRFRHLGFRSLS